MKSQLGNTSNVSVMSSKSSLNATLNGHDKTSLTSSVDAHWIEAQTSGFIDWINFIFASHLTFNDHDEIVGMVVNDDDFLHSTYHIFDVPYISKLPPSMIAQIETDEISIRDDQNIFVDVGLQKILLNILFSYELPWLRLGIEAVLRSEGDALSEDDMHLLSDQVYSCVTSPQKQMNFIKSIIHERFIKDPSILLKYSKQKPLNFQLEAQMHTQMRRQFIKKIFSLIKFLDIARMKQALKLPRLFRADATVKSSQDVLISICKELLRAEGDYLHHLSSVGYKVAFKQSYVDEFDYQVKNLSVDMHDGVRLTKLVSLVADHDGLCDHLRVPAVSRLQKVHNIVTALESLHSSGESIFADLDDGLANESVITARSSLSTINGVKSTEDRMQAEARRIVDGNTEAILVLLWRIMFAFNLRDMIDEPLLLKEVARVARGAVVKGDPRDSLSSVVVDPAVSEAEKKMSPYLMYWCNAVLNLYDITIDDFTTSLADGSVLCLLVHYYHPDLLPLKSINQSYKLQSLDDAKITDLQKRNFVTLRRACKTIGGIPVLSKDYSVQDPPDSQSMTFFLAYLFSRLMACAQTKAAIRIQRVFKLKYASVLVKLRKDKKVKKKPSRFGRTNFLVTISASKHHAAQVIQSMFLRFMQRRRLAQLRTLQSEQASHPEELDDINNSLRLTSFAEECDNSTVFELLPLTKIETETPLINLPDTAVSVTDDYLLGLSSDGTSLPVPVSVRKALGERDMNADSSFADPQTPFGTAQKSHISFFSPEKAANLSFIEKKRRTRSLLASPLFDKENSFAQTPLMVASVDTSEIEDRYRREMESKLKQTAAEMEESLRSQFMTESMVTDGLLKSEREARMTAEMQVKLEAEKRLALERRLQEFENERYEAELRAAREKEEASLRQQKEAAARTIISTQLLSFVHRRRFTKTIHVIIRLQAVARSYLARRKVNTVIRGICKLQLLIKQRLSTRHRSMQHNAATSIQACCRRLLAQKIALSMKQAVIILQSRIRAHLAQVQYRITRQACIRIQSVCRGFIQRSVKKRALAATLLLQGCIRVYLAKKELATRKAAVVTLQACCFRFIQMKRNNAAHTAQQQARLKRRVHILRAAAIIVGVCRAWVRRKRVARAAMRIAVWYQAYLPLLKARKLRKGILRLQVSRIVKYK